jgi:hypothetical protein
VIFCFAQRCASRRGAMRFKCRLINLDLFSRYCAAVQKLSKRCTVLLNPDRISLIVLTEVRRVARSRAAPARFFQRFSVFFVC